MIDFDARIDAVAVQVCAARWGVDLVSEPWCEATIRGSTEFAEARRDVAVLAVVLALLVPARWRLNPAVRRLCAGEVRW